MKKWLIPVIVIGALIILGFIIGGWIVGIKNDALKYDQNVSKSWGNVETSYQRRNDLIGNLVKTVQGAADFEKSTLTDVIAARAKATAINIDAQNITPEQLQQFQNAQSGVTSSLSRLLVTVEKYPDLKTNQNFLKLQDELTSTENTIQTARTRYNEAVEKYNNHILSIPNNWFLAKYKEKPYFKSESGAEKPVDVNFDFK
ncbi:LemA family protein [Zhouia sp. PK063]|uniref:LemA family protein n=1 Tax=Zhouia sp. PK063 TaxID=3373602 RepID=UPI0037BCDEB9